MHNHAITFSIALACLLAAGLSPTTATAGGDCSIAFQGTGPASAGRNQTLTCTVFNMGDTANVAVSFVETAPNDEFGLVECDDLPPGGHCTATFTNPSPIAFRAHCIAFGVGSGPFPGNLRLDNPNGKSLASSELTLFSSDPCDS